MKKAEEDLHAAKVVIEASPMLYDVAAFHSQQAAEKYLKHIWYILKQCHQKFMT